jgi:Tfp pilus assembly protein PilX
MTTQLAHDFGERRGAVLIIALVCLVLVAAMGGTLLRWAAMEHKLLRAKEDESQARWLAEAGIERAAAQLGEATNYTGETWDIAAVDLPSAEPARVPLNVKPIEGQTRRRTIEVAVEYPFESGTPTRLRKEIIYQLPGETP